MYLESDVGGHYFACAAVTFPVLLFFFFFFFVCSTHCLPVLCTVMYKGIISLDCSPGPVLGTRRSAIHFLQRNGRQRPGPRRHASLEAAEMKGTFGAAALGAGQTASMDLTGRSQARCVA